MSDSNNQLQKLHASLLLITKEIKRICEKNNINYFMIAGTLLGAVRHQGFIPWDDDMDLGMLRKDYNAFIEACKKDLDTSKFFLQNIDTDSGFGKFYTRILLKDTYLDYFLIKNVKSQKALFVDIFPYDSVPDSKFLQKKQSVITSFVIRLMKKKLGYVMDSNTLGCKIELFFERFFTKDSLIQIYEKEMQRYNNNTKTKYVNCSNAGYGYFKERLERKWVESNKEFDFEEFKLPGSVFFDEYLTHLYGSYMELPPEEKRVTHQIENIDFGPYDNILG